MEQQPLSRLCIRLKVYVLVYFIFDGFKQQASLAFVIA